jgi:hypothetical protein
VKHFATLPNAKFKHMILQQIYGSEGKARTDTTLAGHPISDRLCPGTGTEPEEHDRVLIGNSTCLDR